MKTKSRILLVLGLVVIAFSCVNNDSPDFSATSVGSVGYFSAQIRCPFTISDESSIQMSGVCWSTVENPTIIDNVVYDSTYVNKAINTVIYGLVPNTTYYVRAFIKTGSGIVYGEQSMFSTMSYQMRSDTIKVDTTAAYMTVLSIFTYPIDQLQVDSFNTRGICWGKNLNAVLSDEVVERTSVSPISAFDSITYNPTIYEYNFVLKLMGLSPNTTYYYRSFSKTVLGYYYSKLDSFKTKKNWVMLHN
jgi:hypothetical protein